MFLGWVSISQGIRSAGIWTLALTTQEKMHAGMCMGLRLLLCLTYFLALLLLTSLIAIPAWAQVEARTLDLRFSEEGAEAGRVEAEEI